MSEHTEPATGGVTVSVRRDTDTLILTVVGELDILTAPAVDEAVQVALADKPPVLVLDLTQVLFLGSAGLSVLLTAHQRAAPHCELRIVSATRPTRRPIELTGLDRQLTLFTSLDEALGTS
jgi:anti-anti-sigma factor